MSRRVVVTGLGAVTPVGNTASDTWENLLQGKCGIDYLTHFDTTEYNTKFGGEVKEFDPVALFGRKEARRMDRLTQFTMSAAQQAMDDSGLLESGVDRTRVGTIVGSAMGGMLTVFDQLGVLEKRGPNRVNPFFIPMVLPDTSAARISIEYGFMGPSMSITAACATGTNAVGEAFEMIARGSADAIVAGGADALILPIIFAGFSVMRAFSTRNDDPTHACRPFDADRDGFVASEGAALLVLEELEHAKARNAHIYAELIGYGTSVDAASMVAPMPDGYGASLAIKAAIERADIDPTEIDYLNAHGTSTRLNDAAETNAIKRVLGDHAYNISVSSTKSMTGHLLGGAGALEALVCAKTLQTNIIAPTINYETPDPECDLDYTVNNAREKACNVAVSNSFGFGGHNATVVLRKFADAE